MSARFGEDYYRRFYFDPRTAVVSRAEMNARAKLIAAYAAHIGLPVRRVLDAGCGIGLLRTPLKRAFPHAEYVGLEYSDYLCERYGWVQGSLATWSADPFDLVVCYDVLQYLDDRTAARALVNGGDEHLSDVLERAEAVDRDAVRDLAGDARVEGVHGREQHGGGGHHDVDLCVGLELALPPVEARPGSRDVRARGEAAFHQRAGDGLCCCGVTDAGAHFDKVAHGCPSSLIGDAPRILPLRSTETGPSSLTTMTVAALSS